MMEGLGQLVMVWAALLFFTWPADRYVNNFVKTLPPKSILRTSDTFVHGFIGALSWQLTCLICPVLEFEIIYHSYFTFLVRPLLHKSNDEKNIVAMVNSVMNFCLAFAFSCFVDIDHVYKDFIQMIQGGPRAPWERGIFHLLLPPLVMTLVLYITAIIFSLMGCLKFGTLIIVCVISHLIRDGIRHGLWLQPIGVTPILPYWLYVVVTLLLPLVVGILTLRLSIRIMAFLPIPSNSFNV